MIRSAITFTKNPALTVLSLPALLGLTEDDDCGTIAMCASLTFSPWAEALDHTCGAVRLRDAEESLWRPAQVFS